MTVHSFTLETPLPDGVTVLEASAGTGKTFTIATLAAKFIAEGLPLERLLLITFTRAATGELRERVRERLVATERALARVVGGVALPGEDHLVDLLATAPVTEVELRRARLERALSDFDAATIETTHGFCQKMLEELGTLADLDPDVRFVDNIDELIGEVIDDLYVRLFHTARSDQQGKPLWLDRAEVAAIARIAISNPTAVIHPQDPPARSSAHLRAWIAGETLKELDARKRRLALMTHDDQLTRLLRTLSSDEQGALAVAKLRERYAVVLVDEFQDTDPVQWEIVRRAFGSDGTTKLVLIGDPKQAIYAFRGADVYSYLEAAEHSALRATLSVNYRSDAALLRGLDGIFGGARLGHPEIAYQPVSAAPRNVAARLHGAPSSAALRVRVLSASEPQVEPTQTGLPRAPSAREYIARDLAADVVALLESGARIERVHGDGSVSSEPIRPGDIAVLVRSHSHAALIRDRLDEACVPAVVGGAASVFTTDSARHWRTVLEALERPSDPRRAAAAAITPLIGWTATGLAQASEPAREELHQHLHRWARQLREQGMAALTQEVIGRGRVAERLLAHVDGERRMTDIQHVAQLLHRTSTQEQLGVAALASWLRERIAQAERERDDERTRRLDTDSAAVQVVTFHSSKGLEFPVIYCPFLWDPGWRRESSEPVYFHDPENGNRRSIDVACDGAWYEEHRRQYRREERGEDLRLAYVALTRAKHQAVLWWAGAFTAKSSPLGRLLFAKGADGTIADDAPRTITEQMASERFAGLSGAADGAVAIERAQVSGVSAWSGEIGSAADLEAAVLGRSIDRAWRRVSYSSITAAAHDALVGSEPEETGVTDEPAGPAVAVAVAAGGVADVAEVGEASQPLAGLEGFALPLAPMAMGARVGTAIHIALQEADFAAADLSAELELVLSRITERTPSLLGCPVSVVAGGLALALSTPLGGRVGGGALGAGESGGGEFTLAGTARRNRLDELVFELPLVGGEQPSGRVGLAAVASLLERWLPADDPLAGYAARLQDPTLIGSFRGFLTGSIDLALRRSVDGTARYAIVDYKTNWLAPPDVPLTAWHYRPEALAAEMQRSHYALQALLYSVALHRYLRWRVPGYDPERHLGGVHYLFLRGMIGRSAPASVDGRPGVFNWFPPAGLIVELSEVLGGR